MSDEEAQDICIRFMENYFYMSVDSYETEDILKICHELVDSIHIYMNIVEHGDDENKWKNLNATAIAKLGGAKKGEVRLKNISPEIRKENARKASNARWANVK